MSIEFHSVHSVQSSAFAQNAQAQQQGVDHAHVHDNQMAIRAQAVKDSEQVQDAGDVAGAVIEDGADSDNPRFGRENNAEKREEEAVDTDGDKDSDSLLDVIA